MRIFSELRDAVSSGNELDTAQILGRIPQPAGEELGLSLFEVMRSMEPEVAVPAAELLASVRGGRGMPFLIEALSIPVRSALEVVELLDFAHLGTGWGRIHRAIDALAERPRARLRLIDRMLERPELAPPRRWHMLTARLAPGRELELLLTTFAQLATRESAARLAAAAPDDTDGDHSPETPSSRLAATRRALATALLARLEEQDDPDVAQEAIARTLVAAIPQQPFVARRLMRMVGHSGACRRSRAIVAALRDDLGLLARLHVDAAVPAFVALVECGDAMLEACALDALDRLAALGSPESWYPLLSMHDPRARALALRAFEQQPDDVSWALGRLLRSSDERLRCEGARTIGHRLLHGRTFGADALQGFVRQIAHDDSPRVAETLDVASVVGLSSPTSRFYAAVELLRTHHVPLLARALDAIEEPRARASFLVSGPLDLMLSALVDAMVALTDTAELALEHQPLLQRLSALLVSYPLELVLSDVDVVLCTLEASHVARLLEALGETGSDAWLDAREHFLRVHAGMLEARTLRRVHDARRAWVALAALESEDSASQIESLRAIRRLDNPMLLRQALALLSSAREGEPVAAPLDARVERELMRLLQGQPHAGSLLALHEAQARGQEGARRISELESRLAQRVAPGPFRWPAARAFEDDATEAAELRVWDRYAAFHRPRQGVVRRALGKPVRGSRALGRVTLSAQALWQRDRHHDDVASWADAALELTREPLPAEVGWDVLVVTLRQFENFGAVEVGVKLWVRSSPATARLPRARPATARLPFVHVDESEEFLARVRWLFESHGARQAVEQIEGLCD